MQFKSRVNTRELDDILNDMLYVKDVEGYHVSVICSEKGDTFLRKTNSKGGVKVKIKDNDNEDLYLIIIDTICQQPQYDNVFGVILYHEIGHILENKWNPAKMRLFSEEVRADRYALSQMNREDFIDGYVNMVKLFSEPDNKELNKRFEIVIGEPLSTYL